MCNDVKIKFYLLTVGILLIELNICQETVRNKLQIYV